MPLIELAERLALLLALAFFCLAFEEIYKRDEPTIPGGIRTFPLVGLAGGMLYLIEPHWLWVAVGVTAAAVLVISTREQMHGLVRLIPQDEVLTAGKFLILVGIILPLTPDTRLIAIAPVTPFRTGSRRSRFLASPI
jgi:uncharacterized membrane protein (DUF4010 family)